MAQDVIPHIAERYRVSEAAARQVERALRATNGRQAQFDHPELGGMGQWMPGMITVGRMNDAQLRTRVEGLCAEIAAIVTGMETSNPVALARDPNTGASSACVAMPAGESWWPAALGHPSAEGDQNGVRYAYFADRDRLLVQLVGRIDAYDTAGRDVIGLTQKHGATSSLACITPEGEIDLCVLRKVDLRQEAQ